MTKPRSPQAKALEQPQHRHQVVPSGKDYDRAENIQAVEEGLEEVVVPPSRDPLRFLKNGI